METEIAKQQMLAINSQQAEFYESRAEAAANRTDRERMASSATNLWTSTRRFLQHTAQAAGVADSVYDLHRRWLGDLSNARVLDFGAASGNPLSLEIAEASQEYHAIDLSPSQISVLQERLAAGGLAHKASAYVMDFLANDWPDGHFDIVYAHSVLHHFEHLPVMLSELRRIVRPGGLVISTDPLQTDPVNRLARLLYRPFQTDRAWEWPFTRQTLRTISQHFEIEAVQGYNGLSKFGYLLRAGRAAHRFDMQRANRLGLPFYLCWQCTLKLRKA